MRTTALAVVCCISISPVAAAALDAPAFVRLADETIEVVVATHLGGRLVVMRIPGRKSVLMTDRAALEASTSIDHIAEMRKFIWYRKPYNGHTVWVGPQGAFWSDQDYKPDHVGKGWPPDPFHSVGRTEVLERTQKRLVVRAPVSKLTGLQMTKTYELLGEGRLRSFVRVVNTGHKTLRRDIWPNTRVLDSMVAYVKLDDMKSLRIDYKPGGKTLSSDRLIPYEVIDGYFTMIVSKRRDVRQVSKYFFTPKPSRVGRPLSVDAFSDDTHLRISAPASGAPPEDQGFIELYRMRDATGGLYELEMHGDDAELAPGDEMTMEQVFVVRPYDGASGSYHHVAAIEAAPAP